MESDYRQHQVPDLIHHSKNGKLLIKKDEDTTYIHIQGPKARFEIFGNLSYHQSWRGNNMIISLVGALTVKFYDVEGND